MDIALKDYHFAAIIQSDEDGYYAHCPDLKGCHAQGDSLDEVIANINDATRLIVEDIIECGEEVPQPKRVLLTVVQITI